MKQETNSAPIQTNQLSNFLASCKFPILSGLFAFLAGFAGKHAFSEDIGGLKSYEFLDHTYAHYAIRGVCAVLMLYFNSLMIKFFIHSLQESGATLTTIMNFSFNFILSGISSFVYFNEPFKFTWILGVSLILCGVFLLSQSKGKTQPTPKAAEPVAETKKTK